MPEAEIPEEEITEESPLDAVVGDEAFADGAQASGAAAGQELSVEDQLAVERDRALRLQAELQNVLMRKNRDVAEERKYGPLALMRDLLPVLDNIDRALEAAEKADEAPADGLLEGFRLVRQQLTTVLDQQGCKRIDTDGAPFDPGQHEAILQQPSGEVPAGTVLLETQSGFLLHDRVVRPAQVIVSSGPAADS